MKKFIPSQKCNFENTKNGIILKSNKIIYNLDKISLKLSMILKLK